MSKRNKKFDPRTAHRVLGLWMFIFVIVAAVTGVLRANAKSLYWKERRPAEKSASLIEPKVSIGKAMEIFQERFPSAQINVLQLKIFLGRTVYQFESKKEKVRLLVDANNAEILSPVKEQEARQIAQSYVSDQDAVLEVKEVASFRARKNQEPRDVFAVSFNDKSHTQIFVDKQTGEVLSVLDDGKRLGLWVNKLHELDFGGLSRVALTVSGVAIVLLSIAGLVLAFPKKQKN